MVGGRRCACMRRGVKEIEVPAHHNVQLYVEEYLEAAELDDKKAYLF